MKCLLATALICAVSLTACAEAPNRGERAAAQSGRAKAAVASRIAELLTALESDGANFAIRELAQIGTTAVDPLIGALKSSNPTVRKQAAFALGLIGEPRGASHLGAATADPEVEVRKAAFHGLIAMLVATVETPDGVYQNGNANEASRTVLVQLGAVSVGPLFSALDSDDPTLRAAAADVLWRIRDARVVDRLILLLGDPVSHVRTAAAMALGFARDPNAVQPLINALGDSDEYVRSYAVGALGNFHDERAIEPLIRRLSDTSPGV